MRRHDSTDPQPTDPSATDPHSTDGSASPSGPSHVLQVVRAGHDGDPTRVRTARTDPDAEVRAAALGALVRLGRSGLVPPTETGHALMEALEDPSPAVRRRAAGECASWATLAASADAGETHPGHATARESSTATAGELITALLPLLDDDDHRVAEVAAFACGEVVPALAAHPGGAGSAESGRTTPCHDAAVHALSRVAIDHDEHLCREAAVAALGSIGDPAGMPAVLAACRDRSSIRRRAVLALAAFDHPDATAELRRLTDDRDLQVRQAAEELLAIESGEVT